MTIYIYKCTECKTRFKLRDSIPNETPCSCKKGILVLVETYANDDIYNRMRGGY